MHPAPSKVGLVAESSTCREAAGGGTAESSAARVRVPPRQRWLTPIRYRADAQEAVVRIGARAYTYFGIDVELYAEFLCLLGRNQGRALALLKRAATVVEKSNE